MPGDQTQCYVATHPNGNTFISWFSAETGGNYYPRIQLFDFEGNQQCANAGLLATDDGGSFVAWPKAVDNGDSKVIVQRITVSGQKVRTISPVDVFSVAGSKGKLDAGEFLSGQTIVARADGRTGNSDIFAQNLSEDGTLGPLSLEINVTPDTLFFLTPESFIDGIPFMITNTGSNPVDILYMQPDGAPVGNFVNWYIVPPIPSYPITLEPGENLTETVFWVVTDGYPGATVFDTLEIYSTADSVHLIIAADSTYIWMGGKLPEPLNLEIFPNPFTAATSLSFTLTCQASINAAIYNAQMTPTRSLLNKMMPPGRVQLIWDGTNDSGIRQPSGIYYVILNTHDYREVRKLIKIN